MKISSFLNFGALLMAGLISGCGISIDNLVPLSPVVQTPRFDKILKVENVTGAQESYFGGPAMVTDEEYTEALVRTLRQSNFFKQVVTDTPGDYELLTTIVAHGQDQGSNAAIGTLDAKHAMVVEYRIVDALSKHPLWKKGFNSRHEVTLGESFSGAARTIAAQEGSVRKNLDQFIRSLSSAKF